MRYVLAPYLRCGIVENLLKLGFGSIQFNVDSRIEEHVRLLDFMFAGAELDDAIQKAQEIFGADGYTVVVELLKRHILLPEGFLNFQERYARPSSFYALRGFDPRQYQANLSKARVVVLGCGGIGNMISLILATAGVGFIRLVDGDTIETSNLTRQYAFSEEDVGLMKVKVLQREIVKRNNEVQVDAIDKDFTCDIVSQCIDNVDLVIVSADKLFVMPLVNHHCIVNKIAYVNIGYVNDIAVWGPFYIPGRRGCFACLKLASLTSTSPYVLGVLSKINDAYQAPSCGPINALASGSAALDIVSYLGAKAIPRSYGRRLGIKTSDMEFDQLILDVSRGCDLCST